MAKKSNDKLSAISGIMVTGISYITLTWQDLIVFSDITKPPLIGGGIFGVLAGLVMSLRIKKARVVYIPIIAISGSSSFYWFHYMVTNEIEFQGNIFLYFLLSLVFNGCLFFLGAQLWTLFGEDDNKP